MSLSTQGKQRLADGTELGLVDVGVLSWPHTSDALSIPATTVLHVPLYVRCCFFVVGKARHRRFAGFRQSSVPNGRTFISGQRIV